MAVGWFQPQRYCPQYDQTDRAWIKDPHDGWGSVETGSWCEDQAWLQVERHKAYWAAHGVKVRDRYMRVVELAALALAAAKGGEGR